MIFWFMSFFYMYIYCNYIYIYVYIYSIYIIYHTTPHEGEGLFASGMSYETDWIHGRDIERDLAKCAIQ